MMLLSPKRDKADTTISDHNINTLIIFNASDYATMDVDAKDEIEDLLDDALTELGIGAVTGGGAGSRVVIIEVEIEGEKNLEKGLSVIRKVLRNLEAPKSTAIKRSKPLEVIYNVYD